MSTVAATSAGVFESDLNLLKTTRQKTQELVAGLSQVQMDFARPGKWSTGEIVDHLLLSERLYREQFAELIDLAKSGRRTVTDRTVQQVNTSPFFLPKWTLPYLAPGLSLMTRFTPAFIKEFIIRYPFMPAQNPDVARPVKGRPADALRQELSASIQETATLLEANPGFDYRHMVVRHPLMGPNNVLELLRVVAYHEERHQGQIADTLSHRDFPKA